MQRILRTIYREVKNRLFYLGNRRFIHGFYQENGYIKTQPFNLNSWHHNLYLFTAEDGNGDKVFIKLTNLPRILKNENQAYKKLRKDTFLKDHIIDCKAYLKKNGFKALVLKRSNGIVLNDQWALNNLEKLYSLIKIVDGFTQLSLIHRDIKLDNFIYEDGHIKVFDFSFMIDRSGKAKLKEIDLSVEGNLTKLKTMGIGYKPESLKWDDYYALHVVFVHLAKNIPSKIPLEKKELLSQYIRECKDKIGTHCYLVSK